MNDPRSVAEFPELEERKVATGPGKMPVPHLIFMFGAFTGLVLSAINMHEYYGGKVGVGIGAQLTETNSYLSVSNVVGAEFFVNGICVHGHNTTSSTCNKDTVHCGEEIDGNTCWIPKHKLNRISEGTNAGHDCASLKYHNVTANALTGVGKTFVIDAALKAQKWVTSTEKNHLGDSRNSGIGNNACVIAGCNPDQALGQATCQNPTDAQITARKAHNTADGAKMSMGFSYNGKYVFNVVEARVTETRDNDAAKKIDVRKQIDMLMRQLHDIWGHSTEHLNEVTWNTVLCAIYFVHCFLTIWVQQYNGGKFSETGGKFANFCKNNMNDRSDCLKYLDASTYLDLAFFPFWVVMIYYAYVHPPTVTLRYDGSLSDSLIQWYPWFTAWLIIILQFWTVAFTINYIVFAYGGAGLHERSATQIKRATGKDFVFMNHPKPSLEMSARASMIRNNLDV